MADLYKQASRKALWGNIKKYRMLYIMVIPGIVYFIVFKYIPLLGNVIAFQDYNIFKGIINSSWIGFRNFTMLFQHGDFLRIFKNTIIINIYDLLFGFTTPLILALVINDISKSAFRKGVQQIVYLPHFLSWTILGGIVITQLLSPSQGLMFASRWSKKLPMHPGWLFKSEIVRAVSDTPAGPYTFQEVVLPARGPQFWDGRTTHNPQIRE